MFHLSQLNEFCDYLQHQWRLPFDLHHYLDMLVMLFAGALWVLLAWNDGGMTPGPLPLAARFAAIALGLHLFTIFRRTRILFRLQTGAFVFLPWLFWLFLDVRCFSPKPWLAETGLITNAIMVGMFVVALHHFRHPWMKWMGFGITLLFVCITSVSSMGVDVHLLPWLLGNAATGDMRALAGSFGSPAGMGAALLIVFFPCCGIAFGLRWRYWQRWLCAVLAVVMLFGIFSTFHLGVLAGFFVGMVLMAFLVIKEWLMRISVIALAAVLTVLFAQWALDVPGSLLWGGDTAALMKTTSGCLRQYPLMGAGTGNFALIFEFTRPDNCLTTPATPGSLPLAILAEHGVIGALLLFAPILWIWGCALWNCLKYPFNERTEKPTIVLKRGKDGKRHPVKLFDYQQPMPDTRLYLGTTLAGVTAAGITLTLDYPGAMPAIACLLALQGGAMLRASEVQPLPFEPPSQILSKVFFAGMILIPVGGLLWAHAPLKSAASTERAANALLPTLPSIATGTAVAPTQDEMNASASAREKAHTDALAAIRANPSNGDAWNLLAVAALSNLLATPDSVQDCNEAIAASTEALRLAPDNYEFYLTHATALRAGGFEDAALAALEDANRRAPRNIRTLVSLANALSRRADNSQTTRFHEYSIWKKANELYPENKIIRRGLSTATLLGNSLPSDNNATTTQPNNTP